MTYDGNGNLTSDGTDTYNWTARNQLASITDGTGTTTFAYDPFGRRSSRTADGHTTRYLHDADTVVQELVDGTPTANLLTGLSSGSVFRRTTTAGSTDLLADRLSSTIALTDALGGVQTTYDYQPFGTTTESGAVSDNPYQFAGQQSADHGVDYDRARYYSPSTGRFISEDPLGAGNIAGNPYVYVGDDPVNSIDPSGMVQVGPVNLNTSGASVGPIHVGRPSITGIPPGSPIQYQNKTLTNLSNAAANTAVHVVMNGTPLGCISGAISHQKDPIGVGQCIVVKTTADVTGCGFGLEAGRVYGPAFGPEGALAGSAAGCVGFGLAAGNGVDPENTASSGG
jgi:RHS repeat-associated protein